MRSAAVLLAWTGLLAGLAQAQSPQRMERLARYYADRDGFSGTVTFAHGSRVIFRGRYGFSDREHRVSFNRHTRFEIASLSKQFTAAAILLLEQDGRLRTSDTLQAVLPGMMPAAWQSITLRQLLTHTSGIADYAGKASESIQYQPHPQADLLDLVKDLPLQFKPGEGFLYSNTNYLLLGMVVAKASGMPLCAFLHRRIFKPLRMADTGCIEENEARPRDAVGYTPVDPGEGKPVTIDPPARVLAKTLFTGAGSLLSTGDDLVLWSDALHHGRVLTAASYREMTTPVREGYGYGLRVGAVRDHLRVDHDGSLPGFHSELEYFPGRDTTVVLLSNQNTIAQRTFTPGMHPIDSELMALAAEPAASVPSEHKEAPISPDALRLLAGRYIADETTQPAFTVSLAGDRLQLLEDGPHSPSQLCGDYGELDFYLADAEALIEFGGAGDAVIFDLRYSEAHPYHRVNR